MFEYLFFRLIWVFVYYGVCVAAFVLRLVTRDLTIWWCWGWYYLFTLSFVDSGVGGSVVL